MWILEVNLYSIYHDTQAGCTGFAAHCRTLVHVDRGSGTQLGWERKKHNNSTTTFILSECKQKLFIFVFVCTLQCDYTWVGDRTWVDLTVVSPSHSDGAAALLFGDVDGQNAVAEHCVVQVQVALLLLICQHPNGCRTRETDRKQELHFNQSVFSSECFKVWHNIG